MTVMIDVKNIGLLRAAHESHRVRGPRDRRLDAFDHSHGRLAS